MTMRQLRNQMVHEYMEDMALLSSALQSGHDFVPTLLNTAHAMREQLKSRDWL
jgi:hypothetical protein